MENYKVNDRIIVRFDEPDGVEYWPAFVRKVNPTTYIIDWTDGTSLDKIRRDSKDIVGKVGRGFKRKPPTMIGIPPQVLDDWLDKSKDRKEWVPPKKTGKATKPPRFNLAGLMSKQKADVRAKGARITIRNIRQTKADGGGYSAFAIDYVNAPPTKWHRCEITGINRNFSNNKVGLKVSCFCERFKFHHEYALNYHGMAHIIHCNGEPPLKTNPTFRASFAGIQVCKHVYALAMKLSRK